MKRKNKLILALIFVATFQFLTLSGAHAEISNFPSTVCSISYGGTAAAPKSEFAGQQGIFGEDSNYQLQVLFSNVSAEVRITDKKLGQKLMMEPAASELGTFNGPIAIFPAGSNAGVFFHCRAMKISVQ